MLEHIQTTNSQTLANSSLKTQQAAIVDKENQTQEFDFEDVLDIFNPLQHLPIVSNIYQEQTQDEISNDAKAVGDIFYGILTGGVFGVISAVGNAVLKQQTDKDLGEHVIAFLDNDNEEIAMTNNVLEEFGSEQDSAGKAPVVSQNDDYWSLRMKQIFGDEDLG